MCILGIIGGRIGKAGNKNVSVILMLIAGVIISHFTFIFLLYNYFNIWYFLSPPQGITLFGGILVLLSGIIVLVSKENH